MINRIDSKKVLLRFVTVVIAATVFAASAFAQVEQPSQITIQGTGLFTRSSTGQIPSNDATNSGGVLVGYSYQFKPLFGVEANYGFTRNTQNYVTLADSASIQTDVHELMAGLIMRIPANIRTTRRYLGVGSRVLTEEISGRCSPGPST